MVFSLSDWEVKISCDTNLRSISLFNNIKELFVHFQIQLSSLSQEDLFYHPFLKQFWSWLIYFIHIITVWGFFFYIIS